MPESRSLSILAERQLLLYESLQQLKIEGGLASLLHTFREGIAYDNHLGEYDNVDLSAFLYTSPTQLPPSEVIEMMWSLNCFYAGNWETLNNQEIAAWYFICILHREFLKLSRHINHNTELIIKMLFTITPRVCPLLLHRSVAFLFSDYPKLPRH